MIEVNNLQKKYSKNLVIKDISLNIPENKITAIIGSNGTGKSTLISMLARILNKDNGQIFIDTQEVEKWDTKELSKKLSILKQSNNLNIKLTVRELISFGRFPYSNGNLTQKDKNIVNQAINYMNLKDIENKFIDELSGGQKQMAYIAMIIAQDTKYIFLDEPLNNLDMKHCTEIMKILENLVKEKNKTVVIVIHDINFVSYYADYIVALKDGRIKYKGGKEEIINKTVLKDIYDIDIDIHKINDKNFCLYYK